MDGQVSTVELDANIEKQVVEDSMQIDAVENADENGGD